MSTLNISVRLSLSYSLTPDTYLLVCPYEVSLTPDISVSLSLFNSLTPYTSLLVCPYPTASLLIHLC